MTAMEYRSILQQLPQDKLKELNEHIFMRDRVIVDAMVDTFEKYPNAESKAVYWLNKNGFDVKTEADRVGLANIDSSVVARKNYRLSVVAIVIAVVSLVVSFIAILK